MHAGGPAPQADVNLVERDRIMRHQQPFPSIRGPYGSASRRFHIALVALFAAAWLALPQTAQARPYAVVAFGDSLSAGYRLSGEAAFSAQLERALRADGVEASVTNAGVSGDTSAMGLERADWSVPDGTDLVIVELGANDMLRGVDPAETRKALDAIVSGFQTRGIKVLLTGMLAAPNLGADYAGRFNAIFPELARDRKVPLYPFFLAGVVGRPELHLDDGMHPNREGVAAIVKGILPAVEAALKPSS